MPTACSPVSVTDFLSSVSSFAQYGAPPIRESLAFSGMSVPAFAGVFFNPRQRAASALHEISYRACYKPAVPEFFVERLTRPGNVVLDPFLGRGTTALTAALMGRCAWGSDVNPLSRILCSPRLNPPAVADISRRVAAMDLSWEGPIEEPLLAFFHEQTLREITALRERLLAAEQAHQLDAMDAWIQMVAVSRLTGHSSGFFSRYTLPPNQAVSLLSQRRINAKRGPGIYKAIAPRIMAKTVQLLSEGTPAPVDTRIEISSADHLSWVSHETVDLVVTSPPFLDVVDYVGDNWLRNWFCGVHAANLALWDFSDPEVWAAAIRRCLAEVVRVLRPGGWIAMEVGDVRGGIVKLDEHVAAAANAVGLQVVASLINVAPYTRTAHIWRVSNHRLGTLTNRVVVARRPI